MPSKDGHYLKCIWRPNACSASAPVVETADSCRAAEVEYRSASAETTPSSLGRLGADFEVDNLTFSLAQVRDAFYPKFENGKSDLSGLFYIGRRRC